MEPRDEQLLDLIARCAIKDQAALKMLLDKVGPFLNGVAFRILKSEDLSNDVLQEAFVQIWNNAGSYRPHIAKPLTWMSSIVRYRAIDRLNKEKRYQDNIVSDDDGDIYDNLESQDTPEMEVSALQDSSHIKECLDGLNDKVKISVELAYLHGYSRDEIAAKLEANTNTVKSWLHRGVEKLRQCLEAKLVKAV